jgi:hypothetical protein
MRLYALPGRPIRSAYRSRSPTTTAASPASPRTPNQTRGRTRATRERELKPMAKWEAVSPGRHRGWRVLSSVSDGNAGERQENHPISLQPN